MSKRAGKLPPYKNQPVKSLVPYANNARTHSELQVTQIAKSIAEFGFINPVVVDENNEIIAGHGRVLAAAKLNLEEVPTIEVSWLSEQQRKAFVLADNKIAEGAGWDTALLKVEIESLGGFDFDLSLTGFNDAEIGKIFSGSFEQHIDGTNYADEWRGMPEFNQPDQMPMRSIIVHFDDQESVEAFAKLMNQQITDKTKWLWHPRKERSDNSALRYAATADES